MISKTYSKTRKKCRVTFKFVPETQPENVVVLGEFNEWEPKANPLAARKDGSFSATVSVDAPASYRFRYLIDGKLWENDSEADDQAVNRFGSYDSVLEV